MTLIRCSPEPASWRTSACCCIVEARLEQDLGDAEDAVHRRADLVAHVGEECRLLARRAVRVGGLRLERAPFALELRARERLLDELHHLALVDRPHPGVDVACGGERGRRVAARCKARGELLEGEHQLVVIVAVLGDPDRCPCRLDCFLRASDGTQASRLHVRTNSTLSGARYGGELIARLVEHL